MTSAARENFAEFLPPASNGITRRRFLTSGMLLGGLAGFAPAAYAAADAAFDLRVTRYRLTPANWPAGRKLSLSVIADLHAGGPNMGLKRVRQVVDTANALNSDLTLLLGDYFAGHPFNTEPVSHVECAAELSRLRAPLGVYGVYGNHDWWYGYASIREAFGKAGLPLLENKSVAAGQGANRVWIAGLGDQLARPLGRGKFRGIHDLPGTLAQVGTDDPVILLAHEPDIFPKVPERVALTLSGHTHGGQLRIPLMWKHWVPSRYGARYAYGHVVEQNRHLIVSGGLGTSLVPMRLGVPPEIVRIDIG